MIEPSGGPSAPRRGSTWRAVALLVGMVGLVLAVRATLEDTQDLVLPGPLALVAALLLTRLALSCGALAWVRLIGPPANPHLVTAALYQSQLVKYLPAGGIVQAAGQVAMTAMHGVPVRRVTLAYLVLAVETIAAGLFLTSSLCLVEGAPGWLRAAAPLGLAAPLALHRPLLSSLLRSAQRLSRRVPSPDLLPEQRVLWEAFGCCVLNHVFYASGFTVLLQAVNRDVPVAAATLGYVLSWVAGFLVIPVPSGVGVREAVLVAVVPSVTAAPLLAASLAQRLVAVAAEVLAALGNRVIRLIRATRAQVGD